MKFTTQINIDGDVIGGHIINNTFALASISPTRQENPTPTMRWVYFDKHQVDVLIHELQKIREQMNRREV